MVYIMLSEPTLECECFSVLTCSGLQRLVVEGQKRSGLFGQETFTVFRIQSDLMGFIKGHVQRLRAELPGRFRVLGQTGHERGGERHALRQAGAESAGYSGW